MSSPARHRSTTCSKAWGSRAPMNAFAESLDLLQEFLTEAGELLDGVDVKLVELEGRADDTALLNDIFRGFHTIKGGAGFLDVPALVELCHKTENLFDKLRSGGLALDAGLMDVILEATGEVRRMFEEMAGGVQPAAAPPALIAALVTGAKGRRLAPAVRGAEGPSTPALATGGEADWAAYHAVVAGKAVPSAGTQPEAASPPANAPAPRLPSRTAGPQKETTLRIDITRFDQLLNLSGEIGLTKNRLACLKRELAAHGMKGESFQALDEAVDALDMLVGDLQNAVMKARMQPVGRVFQKYIRQARDLARSLG